MKKSKFLSIIIAAVVLISYSCSNNEELGNENKKKSSIEQKFNASKKTTFLHNTMLDNMYTSLKNTPLNTKGSLIDNEKQLDAYISIFIDANKKIISDVTTRSEYDKSFDFSYLKQRVLQNHYLQNSKNQTRSSSEEIQYPDYLVMFYNESFKSDELDIKNLQDDILNKMNKVLSAYPNLTEEEIDGLAFVAGVTYNSALYWHENAEKWVEQLSGKPITKAGLWDAIRSGTKKWAKADSSGAIEVWAASRLASVASGGTALLAGAAVGSAIGAWENLPFWD